MPVLHKIHLWGNLSAVFIGRHFILRDKQLCNESYFAIFYFLKVNNALLFILFIKTNIHFLGAAFD